MKNRIILSLLALILISGGIQAQVKIGDNPNTINANSLLELESTNKGFLPPRVAINDLTLVAPLTGTVPAGMLVYSSGGAVADGYYYWNGSQWAAFTPPAGSTTITSKSANATLAKSEVFVIASGEITLTLPAITGADNGLSMTIKHVGTHLQQVNVVPSGSSTIDGLTTSKHFRWVSKTYVASGGNWLATGNVTRTDNVFDVSETGSWTTIEEVLDFLNVSGHMVGPSVVRLVGGDYNIDATQTIDLPFDLTIQGSSYGAANVIADGLSGPMFTCLSNTYFKMLAFDADGNAVDAIQLDDANPLDTDTMYYEVKDCTFENGFDKAIVALTNVEFWVFEVDIIDAVTAGIEIAAGTSERVSFKISETDFIDCGIGIHFLTGTKAVVSILNCGFYNPVGTSYGIKYVPGASTTFSTMFITNNTWNNKGTFMDGFNFALTSGRDANAFIKNNSGASDKNPHCRINVTNNLTATNIVSQNTWYKADWGSQTSDKTKWTIDDLVVNKITYQPVNKSDCWSMITGNLTASANNETLVIAIVKKGVSTVRYGETEVRLASTGQPYQFATSIYITDIAPGDFFEIWVLNKTGSGDVTFNDVQWFTETK
jgi:hypothetical protein